MKTALHLFGATTPTGEAFSKLAQRALTDWPLLPYSHRRTPEPNGSPSTAQASAAFRADFTNPSGFRPAGNPGSSAIWISFGPIWLLAPFLDQLRRNHPERLQNLRGLIACSSSSALTKRFAANRFDSKLASRLRQAEDEVLASSSRLEIACLILRPTLIYGQVGPYSDRNLSTLLALMQRLPLLPLPAHTGLRQPIHANQLAAVALQLARQMAGSEIDPTLPKRLAIGGDSTLSYRAMLVALKRAQPHGSLARRCLLLPVPDRLFLSFASPLLLLSPKTFEAVQRMRADLAGFTSAHQLLGEPPQPFPVQPLVGENRS